MHDAASLAQRIHEFSERVHARGRNEDLIEELLAQREELLLADEELHVQLEQLEQANQAVVAEAGRLRQLFDLAPDPWVITDEQGMVVDLNASAQALLVDTFHPTHPLAVHVLRDDDQELRAAITTLGSENAASIERLRLKTRTGVRTMSVMCRKMDATRLLFIFRDARVAELERALHEKEERLVREREQREQLAQTNRAKDRFLAVLSHDLRTPINAVLGWANLLRRETLDRVGRDRALSTIERNARSQLALVEELLDVARIAEDKLALAVVPLDLGALVRVLADASKPLAIEQGITLEVSVPTEPVSIFADRRRIEQITNNLLSNALKFTPAGGRVDVEVRHDDRWARLVVRDSGKGIAPELLPSIFDCFAQDASDFAAGKGLGLGLYIVRRLVELHGGTVRADSAGPDQGATFTIDLPAREVTVEQAAASETLVAASDLSGVNVLLVEDDASTREIMSAVLLHSGACVAEASDVRTALAMLKSRRPDVIVSDLGLPDKDGCSLLRQLRAEGVSLPALAVSGYAQKRDAERALEAGFDGHLAKPVEPPKLVSEIRRLLERD